MYLFWSLNMAAGEGFEPSHTESESAVLPLHNPAVFRRTKTIIQVFSCLSTVFSRTPPIYFHIYFPNHCRRRSHSSTARNFNTYPLSASVISCTSSPSSPARSAVSSYSVQEAMHSGGYTTHHQFRPAPSPMMTRSAMYSPAGRAKPSYSFRGNSVISSAACTGYAPPQAS